MASGVVKVGRRIYAVGLLWQPSPSGRIAQAAREAAAQPGQQSDFYCVRAASKSVAIPQYGLAQSAQGHKAGMPTLAASLGNAQPGSWAGAFRLREGTWVIVVRDDLIAPDGDILFDNDEAARDRLLQEVSLGGVQRVYAPDGWAVPGSDPTPLPLLLQERAECRLQPVRVPMRLVMYGLAGIALIALLIFLAMQWQAEQERLELEAQVQQRAAMEASKAAGAVARITKKWEWPPAEEAYERKWEKAAFASDLVKNCASTFMRVQSVQLGWKRSVSTCQDNRLTIVWLRDRVQHTLVPAGAIVREDLSQATQTINGDVATPRGPQELWREVELSEKALREKWPVSTTRLEDDTPMVSPPPDMKDPPPPPPPPWRKRGIKYSGKAPPWVMWKYFENIPGLILNKIVWDGSVWTLEATIYEKRGG